MEKVTTSGLTYKIEATSSGYNLITDKDINGQSNPEYGDFWMWRANSTNLQYVLDYITHLEKLAIEQQEKNGIRS